MSEGVEKTSSVKFFRKVNDKEKGGGIR